ncbi:MAG: SpoIIE family protein phosphatase [Desulfobacterales bacterium]|nr:SpoIIE family protein phosphatase [Desulfobacterales bacterium]
MNELILADIFYFLDIAVIEQTDNGLFQLISPVPDCMKPFFPQAVSENKGFKPDENSLFLENFLIDAEEWWAEKKAGTLKSGIWTEIDLSGEDCEFEATAVYSGNRKILLIELARYSYEEKQSLIQKSRELSLAYHRLAQAEAELQKSKQAAEEANKKIISSIRYAKTIQYSQLPKPDNIKACIPDSFYIWMPRDIVGGDFIFTHSFEDSFVIAVIDCTGHGVPGAFITMIASFALKKTVEDEDCRDPAHILKRINYIVKTTLQQDMEYALSDDGLDAAICYADSECLTFAGAKRPIIYIQNGEANLIKGDKMSLGYRRADLGFNFTNHRISIEKGMTFYLYTDGFVDQIGGEKNRSFGTRRFKDMLEEIAHLPFNDQQDILLRAFDKYKGDDERQDDVTVVGFRPDSK